MVSNMVMPRALAHLEACLRHVAALLVNQAQPNNPTCRTVVSQGSLVEIIRIT